MAFEITAKQECAGKNCPTIYRDRATDTVRVQGFTTTERPDAPGESFIEMPAETFAELARTHLAQP